LTASTGSRLPALGPRGEGWVAGQLVLLGFVAVAGLPGLGDLPPATAGRWALFALGLALLALGVGIGFAAARALGSSISALPRPKETATFASGGIYAVVRHPMYLALVVASVGWALAMASTLAALAAVALVAWLNGKARREEAWLMDRYPEYAAYRRRTGRFLPRIGASVSGDPPHGSTEG
jgi:protein-S-isoprenylcysteine O-methyltransferase Ste14